MTKSTRINAEELLAQVVPTGKYRCSSIASYTFNNCSTVVTARQFSPLLCDMQILDSCWSGWLTSLVLSPQSLLLSEPPHSEGAEREREGETDRQMDRGVYTDRQTHHHNLYIQCKWQKGAQYSFFLNSTLHFRLCVLEAKSHYVVQAGLLLSLF